MVDSPPVYAEVWTIDQSRQAEWASFLQQQGIDPNHFKTVLSVNQAAQIRFGDISPTPKKEAVQTAWKEPTLLWRNEAVEVYVPGEPRVLNHLMVVLKRPVRTLADVTEEESIEMRSAVKKIQRVLREEFGTPSLIAQWNKAQPRQLAGRCTIEVIPTRPESAQVFDVCDRAECTKYCLWQGRFSSTLPLPSEEEVAQSCSDWKRALEQPAPPFSTSRFDEPPEKRKILWTKKAETEQALRDPIFQILQERFPIRRERAQSKVEIPDQWVSDPAVCTFCNERILNAEKIYETDLSYVLLNQKSPVLGAHFLIFPKRHVRSSENLREDELKDMHSLAREFIHLLGDDVLLYTQDDPAVAQKVPHTHTHVMQMPGALKLLLFTMNYDREPALSREKMQELVQEMRGRRASWDLYRNNLTYLF